MITERERGEGERGEREREREREREEERDRREREGSFGQRGCIPIRIDWFSVPSTFYPFLLKTP